MRATVEASFGQDALTQAAWAAHRQPARFDPRPRSGGGRLGAFLPHGPGVEQALFAAVRAARPWHTPQPASAEHLALGILAVSEGLVPPILSAIGTSGPALSAAIRHRYHQAR